MAPDTRPIGQAALIERYGLRVPSPAVISVAGAASRRTVVEGGRAIERYPAGYAPDDDLVGHLKFAFRREALDVGLLHALFKTIDPAELEGWIRSEPNGGPARRVWFLYEWLTGRTLDVPDARVVRYVDALDSEVHITASPIPSRRHKVNDNLLGGPGFAPTVRRTPRIVAALAEPLAAEARAMMEGCDPAVLRRAVGYLYTKETKSSFAIERETIDGGRAERFIAALKRAGRTGWSLVELQNMIVDKRYAATGWRDFQVFVGSGRDAHREEVHFIAPKPEDAARLMSDWDVLPDRLAESVDPVTAAALISFAFVFIHPFGDGNGRIHRFLAHHVLAERGFTPPGVLFPLSAAIERDRAGYDAALEAFSGSIMPFIDWRWTPSGEEIVVENDTIDLYRHFDATPQVEYLHAKVAEAVRKDLREELEYVDLHDRVFAIVRARVDMPDRRASLLTRCLLQNGGTLAKRKREEFAELTDDEVSAIERGTREAITERNSD